MNEVDTLLVNSFSVLSYEEKKRVKELGPHKPKTIVIKQVTKRCTRTFNPSLFDSTEWLTASTNNKSLFCFYCLLFGGDRTWSAVGFSDICHLQQAIASHNRSKTHITNCLRYKTFGTVDISVQIDEGNKLAVSKSNEEVKKNRHILSKIIDCIVFCGVHELALRGHDETEDSLNRGVFLDLLHRDSLNDKILYNHLSESTVAKWTSKDIQNELLDCIYSIYFENLLEDVSNAKYISIQADEATDVSHTSQFVIILRFLKNGSIVERFLKFVDIQDRSAEGLCSTIVQALEPFNVKDKLIAQTYDGAAVMSGRVAGVQALIREQYPSALFVHCYAHQLNLILKQACSSIRKCKIFFANASGFATFFSHSTKRFDVLREICKRSIPKPSDTRWNYISRLINTIFVLKDDLEACFEFIIDGSWDDLTTREAVGLLANLRDPTFDLFLRNFNTIFSHVDILFNVLQQRNNTVQSSQCQLDNFSKDIQEIRQTLSDTTLNEDPVEAPSQEVRKRRRDDGQQSNKAALLEACDIIIHQVKDRFANQESVQAFHVVDPRRFAEFEKQFPTKWFERITGQYKCLNSVQLKAELEVLYSSSIFQSETLSSVNSLYNALERFNLRSNFSEVTSVLEIALTTPSSSSEAERSFSTLKRVKNLKRSTMGQDRLNALALLTIHKDVTRDIEGFNEKVINKFASSKVRRADLFYK